MKKPNLFIVGLPKTGSTSLYYYLKEHPEIYFDSEYKEPDFFFSDSKKRKTKTLKEYLGLYRKSRDEKILGDASVSYIKEKKIAKKIKKFNPKANIIIIIRNPLDWLISFYNMETRSNKSAEDINNILIKKNSFERKLKTYLKNVGEFKKIFGENLKIILQEDLKKDTIKTYKDILYFLKVENKNFTPEIKEYNPHGKPRFNIITKIRRYLIENISENSRNIIRKIIHYKLRQKIHDLNRKKTKKPELSKEVRERIKKEFKPYVKELEEITKRPLLKEWDIE